MKLIYLNAIITTPNENGLEKIEKSKEKDNSEINYHSLGIRPPKGDVERDEDGNIILDEEDFEDVTVPVTIPIKNLVSWVADLDGGTRVYTKNGVAYDVIEEFSEIDAYIELLSMSFLNKQLAFFQSFLRQIKNKITGEKEIKY